MNTNSLKILKQRLLRVHVTCGITVSLLMYMSLFFGIFAIFKPYIDIWEKPSLHISYIDSSKIDYSSMLEPYLSKESFKNSEIDIYLPGSSSNTIELYHDSIEEIVFNPRTGKEIHEEKSDVSRLGRFLNIMHYGRPLGEVGSIVFGLSAVGCLFLLFGGLILIIIIKYKNNVNNRMAKFSKWHRKIFLYVFPVLFLLSLTGAIMNIGYSITPPLSYILSHGETTDMGDLINPKKEKLKSLNIETPMLSINYLLKEARKYNSDLIFQDLVLNNWGDKSAQISIQGFNPYKPFLNGLANEPTIILSAVDASLIKNTKTMDASWDLLLRNILYYLHILWDVDIITRIIVVLFMLFSAIAIAFGVMMFLEKRATKFKGSIPFYDGLEKLCITIMIGCIPAVAFIFNLQWLIPFDILNRVIWVEGLFYLFWLLTFVWSFYRISSHKTIKEFLYMASILFILAPVTHWFNSGFNPLELYTQNMNVILNVDISLFILGITLYFFALKVPNNREEAKTFWQNKTKNKGTI